MNPSFEYLERRLEPQEKWHEEKARWNKWLFYTMEVVTLLSGAAIPVVNLWVIKDAYLAGVLSAILGGLVVVAAAVGKLSSFTTTGCITVRSLKPSRARRSFTRQARVTTRRRSTKRAANDFWWSGWRTCSRAPPRDLSRHTGASGRLRPQKPNHRRWLPI
jgi:hypothetical protein